MKANSLTLTQYDVKDTETLIPALLGSIPAGPPITLSSEIEMVNLFKFITGDYPDATLYRVNGVSMVDEVNDGDWIVATQTLDPNPGDIVIAEVNGEQTLKHFKLNDRRGKRGLFLVPANTELPVRELTHTDDVRVLAVVTKVIHDKRRRTA